MVYQKLAIFSIKHSKMVIITWLCFLIVFGHFAVKLPSVLKDHGLKIEGSYLEVQKILSSEFHIPDNPVILLFQKQREVSRKQFHQFISLTLSRLQGVYGLDQVVSPLTNDGMEDGNVAYALLSFRQEAKEMKPVIDQMKRWLPRHHMITVKMTGQPVVQEDVNKTSQSDLKKAELIGVPIAFLILLLSFGGFISSLIPVLVGVIGVAGSMGIMYWIGTRFELSIFVLNVIPMVGLALSIDFALMLVSRFREELKRYPPEQALIIAMRTSGKAIVFSALCVFLGLTGTLFIRMPIFNSVALGAMIVLMVSLLLTLTFVPALLAIMGDRLKAESRTFTDSNRTSPWYLFSAFVMRSPVRMGLLASLVLTGCLLPLDKMNITIPDATSLPKGYESRNAAELFNLHFTSLSASQVFIIAEGREPNLQTKDWMNALDVVQKLKQDPNVIRIDSVFSKSQLSAEQLNAIYGNLGLREKYEPVLGSFVQGNRILISVILRSDAASKEAMDWVRSWEQQPAELRLRFGGEPKYQQEVFDEIFNNIQHVLLFIFASNFIILFIAFRSILIPIKTIFMNLLSIGASFGILVWIFEKGHLGMEPTSIAIMIPVFIFGLTFGISMDYGVFLISRISEIYRKTKDNDRSVREGLAYTSKIISSAAAIMIAVVAPFSLGGVMGVKQLGIGIAAAIFIDATIIRMILVPSLMKLFGRWNWWAP